MYTVQEDSSLPFESEAAGKRACSFGYGVDPIPLESQAKSGGASCQFLFVLQRL